MTESERVLLALIRHSLFGTREAYPADTDWDEVLREAQAQAVVGLAAGSVPKEKREPWTIWRYQTAADHTQIRYEQSQLIQLLSSKGIPVAILKGTAAAVYYPVPGLRALGDVDFIVPKDKCEETKAVLCANGYIPSAGEHDPTRHTEYQKSGVVFEFHHRFSHSDQDIESYIDEGMKHLETATVDAAAFPMLPRLANGLVLLAHMKDHLKYGMGLRQAIDWMMFVYKALDDDFWKTAFKKAAESVGLDTLAITAARMSQIYLGLPDTITWCRDADPALCETLMDSLLSSGNFGRKLEGGIYFESVTAAIKTRGLFRYIQYAGEHNWKAYQKHPWLKPFCWLYQIGRYLRQTVQSGRGKKMLNDLSRGKDRGEMLKKQKL